jgi:aminopeptidase N
MLKRNIALFIFLMAIPLTFKIGLSAQNPSVKKIELKALDYTIDFFVDYDKEKISARCRFTVQNPTKKPIKHIPVLLYKEFHVSSLKDERGQNTPFTQKIIYFEDWDKLKVNYIEVSLENPLLPGDKTSLNITYEGGLSGYEETGMSYVKDHINRDFTFIREECKTYPIVSYPNLLSFREAIIHAQFDYLVKVTVPDSLVVANGGQLVDKTLKDGLATYTYRNIKPAWRIDIAISDYGLLEDKVNRFRIYHFKEDAKGAKIILDAMKKTINILTERLGTLKDKENVSISVIEIPLRYGAQNDTTCITMPENAFKGDARVSGLYHEISHWWNVRPTDPYPCRMESEGFASFMEGWIDDKLENRKSSLKKRYEKISGNLKSRFQKDPKAKNVPIIDYGKESMTGLSYSKGSAVFILLYDLLGEKSFFNILGSFYSKYFQTGATTDDFTGFINKNSKIDLSLFFKEWIYGIESNQYIMEQIPYEKIIKKYK